MADQSGVYTADELVNTGAGNVFGLVASVTSAGADGELILYDNTAGSGTKIFQAVLTGAPLIIFFSDRFSPKFDTGLYAVIPTGISLTLWYRQL